MERRSSKIMSSALFWQNAKAGLRDVSLSAMRLAIPAAAIIGLSACVVAPPPPRTVVVPAPPPQKVFVYPANGQSAEQTDRDRNEGHVWAVQQTAVDPSRADANPYERVVERDHQESPYEGACLSIPRGRDRGRFPLRQGGADEVGLIPNEEATTPHEGKSARSRRVGKERGVCGVARLVHSIHYGPRRAPCIRSLSLPTRLTRNTQTGSWYFRSACA